MHTIKLPRGLKLEFTVSDEGVWEGVCAPLDITVKEPSHDAAVASMLSILVITALDLTGELETRTMHLETLREACRNVCFDQQTLIEGLVSRNRELHQKLRGK